MKKSNKNNNLTFKLFKPIKNKLINEPSCFRILMTCLLVKLLFEIIVIDIIMPNLL